MFEISFTKEALFDFEDALFWYEKQRIGLSYDFELCVDAGLAEISRNPDNFQIKYKTTRVRYILRFPYGIHYIVNENRIFVIAIFHTSRSPKNWTKRR